MFVVLNRERLVCALIQMAAAHAIPMEMPAPNVGCSQSLNKISEIAVSCRPQDHVPMIWHDAKSKYFDRNQLRRFADDAQEGLIIEILVEDPRSRIGAIEHVEDHTSWRNTNGAGHGANLFHKAPIFQ